MKRICPLLIVLFDILLISASYGSGDNLIPMEKFFDNPQVDNCKVSPDGLWLSCLKPYQGKLNVSIRNIVSGEERFITSETERPVLNYFWSGDSQTILYLWDHLGDENYHLMAVSIKRNGSSKQKDLTPFQGVAVEPVSVPPKSSTILITMNKRKPELMDAYWLDIHSGQLQLSAENPGNFTGYLADMQNQVRVASAISGEGETEIYSRATETEPWHLVKKYPIEDTVATLAFHPDGKRIYLKSSYGKDLAALCLLDLATGSETIVHEDPEKESDLVHAFFDPTTNQLLATLYQGDKIRAYGATPEVKQDLEIIVKASEDNFYFSVPSDDQKKWAVTHYSPTNPGQVFLYDRQKKKLQLMAESRPWLKAENLAEAQSISYMAKDGLKITGYLTLPRGTKPQNLPMVLLVHGGPWSRDEWSFDSLVQFLANRGYAVLQINYRGSVGFGKKFAYAAKKEFAKAMHQDLIDGVNWVLKQGIVDPKRIAIMGLSYGGYATLVGLTFTPETFACGVDYAGASSLITLIESFPPSWKPFLARRWYPLVGNPSDPNDREDLKSRSPLYSADRIKSPLFIYQGVNDPRVTRVQADQIAVAAANHGVEVQYLVAKDEGHGLDNPQNALAVFRATEKFLGTCLHGNVQSTAEPQIENLILEMTVDVNKLQTTLEKNP